MKLKWMRSVVSALAMLLLGQPAQADETTSPPACDTEIQSRKVELPRASYKGVSIGGGGFDFSTTTQKCRDDTAKAKNSAESTATKAGDAAASEAKARDGAASGANDAQGAADAAAGRQIDRNSEAGGLANEREALEKALRDEAARESRDTSNNSSGGGGKKEGCSKDGKSGECKAP